MCDGVFPGHTFSSFFFLPCDERTHSQNWCFFVAFFLRCSCFVYCCVLIFDSLFTIVASAIFFPATYCARFNSSFFRVCFSRLLLWLWFGLLLSCRRCCCFVQSYRLSHTGEQRKTCTSIELTLQAEGFFFHHRCSALLCAAFVDK